MSESNIGDSPAPEAPGGTKKGLGTWGWVAIGCGALILISFVMMSAVTWFAAKKVKEVASDFEKDPARSAAEWIVKMNPDLELVESDESSGTITVRQKSTGETATFDWSEFEEGKLEFEAGGEEFSLDLGTDEKTGAMTITTNEGEATFGGGSGKLPAFVPLYPGGSEPVSVYSATTNEMASGIATIETEDDVDAVVEHYRTELEAAGYSVDASNYEGSDGSRTAGLNARHSENESSVNVTASRQEETTQITIQYNGKE